MALANEGKSGQLDLRMQVETVKHPNNLNRLTTMAHEFVVVVEVKGPVLVPLGERILYQLGDVSTGPLPIHNPQKAKPLAKQLHPVLHFFPAWWSRRVNTIEPQWRPLGVHLPHEQRADKEAPSPHAETAGEPGVMHSLN